WKNVGRRANDRQRPKNKNQDSQYGHRVRPPQCEPDDPHESHPIFPSGVDRTVFTKSTLRACASVSWQPRLKPIARPQKVRRPLRTAPDLRALTMQHGCQCKDQRYFQEVLETWALTKESLEFTAAVEERKNPTI